MEGKRRVSIGMAKGRSNLAAAPQSAQPGCVQPVAQQTLALAMLARKRAPSTRGARRGLKVFILLRMGGVERRRGKRSVDLPLRL